MCVNLLSTYIPVPHMCAVYKKGHKSVSDPLELDLEIVVRKYDIWVMKTEPWSYGVAARALNQ